MISDWNAIYGFARVCLKSTLSIWNKIYFVQLFFSPNSVLNINLFSPWPTLIPVETVLALSETDGPSCPVAEEGGWRGGQCQVRERRESSSLGLPGASLRARRLRGAVRRFSVTIWSLRGVFLELCQLRSHCFHWLSVVCGTLSPSTSCLLLEELPFPVIGCGCSVLKYIYLHICGSTHTHVDILGFFYVV